MLLLVQTSRKSDKATKSPSGEKYSTGNILGKERLLSCNCNIIRFHVSQFDSAYVACVRLSQLSGGTMAGVCVCVTMHTARGSEGKFKINRGKTEEMQRKCTQLYSSRAQIPTVELIWGRYVKTELFSVNISNRM